MTKYVYSFKDGQGQNKDILGGKGKNLAEMSGLGLPIPPGFIITTEVCEFYYENPEEKCTYPIELEGQILTELKQLEATIGKKLGDPVDPLLVSVRSGAAQSMPGMMDTILNLGINDKSAEGLIKKTNNPRFVYDSYRRFIQMFGDVVMEVKHSSFEHALHDMKTKKGVKVDTDLNADDLKALVAQYKEIVRKETGKDFPQDPMQQMWMSIEAVVKSWNNDRAKVYRRLNNIRGLKGTAVCIQSMVFGNMGETSGTGVCFTRNPSTGENKFYGEYLMNAQGEDVVAGIRTPLSIDALEKQNPVIYKQLTDVRSNLEKHYKDMQDIEFTIQEGRLFILQTRNGKRTAASAVRIAVDMVKEGVIDEKTAVLRVSPASLDQLLHKQIDPLAKQKSKLLTKGLPASPGAAVGKMVFTAEKAHDWAQDGEDVVLVRIETSPEDIEGMHAAEGILTSRGGMTSHAAVVARGMGTCCVAGCGDLQIDEEKKQMIVAGELFKEGDMITLDGSTGEVFKGALRVVDPEIGGDFQQIMDWADKYRKLKVRANADIPTDAIKAREFGAEGIGLCRTEHMFFEETRIKAVREMIVAKDVEARKKALAKILPMQKSDFMGLYEAMEGYPVTIRLLDPPLHEFLPKEEADIIEIAKELGISVSALKETIDSLHEFNPMLGHRGCRLAITYPEIAEMQTEAIISAALELVKKGKKIVPEIMVPLVGTIKELDYVKGVIVDTAGRIMEKEGYVVDYKIGTMIEVPRGALTADELAASAEFFSFGTNDLTQMTLGFSRDDAGKFIKEYIQKDIFEVDPFQSIDQTGVGMLMRIAVEKGKRVRDNIKLGICGEHGGDPASVEFCHSIGLNYVSCSPFRVPIARLAAAHAALKEKK